MTKNVKDNPGVIAPPPLIFLFFFLAGYGANRLYPLLLPELIATTIFGWVIMSLSLMIFIGGLIYMKRAKTPVNPYKASEAIVKDGPFRFTRNPFYLSLVLIYSGLAFVLLIAWPLLLLPLTLLVMHYGVIVREENYLVSKFGDEYRNYKEDVPRWLI